MITKRPIRVLIRATAVAVTMAFLTATGSVAGDAASLGDDGAERHWDGVVPQGAVVDPALCTPLTCATTELVLARPAERLVVAIDTSEVENTFDFLYDIQLHLYDPGGALAGSGSGSFESSVVVVDGAEAGTWRAVVVPESVVGELPYRGYAATTTAPAAGGHEPADLLPNLVPQPLTNLRLSTAPMSGPPPFTWDFRESVHGPSSCYPQETAELGARRCLRFDQTVANVGEGPLELRAAALADGPMDQRIHRSDGSFRDVAAGGVRFHAEHLHFHYQDYAQVRMYAITSEGARGPLVRAGAKQGFCLADTRNMRFGQPDQRPAYYVEPWTCDGRDEPPAFSRVGLTPGWADTYPWFIPEQFIEISGIADGRYELAFSVNESGALHETRLADNTSSVIVDLAGETVTVVASPPPRP